MATQCMYTSKPFYRHPDRLPRPSGAYATHLQPWMPMTQRELRGFLYAVPKLQDVSNFVAIDAAGFTTLGVEPYKFGMPGSCVPVTAMSSGANLMLP